MPHLRTRFSLRILWVSAASLALLAPFAALKILEPNPVAPVSSPVKTVPLPSSAAQQAVASLRQDATATRLAGLKAGPTSDAAMGARLVESYGKLPLSFEANQGQTDAQVKFLSRGSGYGLFLTGDEAVLALRSRQSSVVSRQLRPTTDSRAPTMNGLLPSSIINLQSSIDNPPAPSPQHLAPSVLRLKLVGANPKAKVAGLDELPGKSNYFLGNDPKKWRTNVPNYAQVRYKDVYPGIDLVYYGHQGQLEYDWVVAPGADPRVIALNVEGAEKMEIDAQGDLVLRADGGDIRLHKPVVYQEQPSVVSGQSSVAQGGSQQTTGKGPRTTDPAGNSPFTIHHSQLVEGRYVLAANNQVTFEVTRYDKTKPLIIDPVLSYATFLGGSGGDWAHGIAVDSSGNAYVIGQTRSTDFPVTTGAFQTALRGYDDAFVTKLSADGSALLYSTYLGGSGEDYANAIAVDSSGNAYVTGVTDSTNFPVTAGAFQTAYGGSYDAFVTKLNAAGSGLVYSTYLGGRNDEMAFGVAVDSSWNAYVTGLAQSNDFPVTAGAFQTVCGGCPDYPNAFVTKLSVDGSALVYSTYLGGGSGDDGRALAVDSSGSAYVTGRTSSTDFPVTAGAFQTAIVPGCAPYSGPSCDVFVTKLSADGSALVYSTYLGGSSYDYGAAIAVDSAENAYVTGITGSTDFPTRSATQATPGGAPCTSGSYWYACLDAFVTKLNAAGSALVYSTYLGGSDWDEGYGIAVDSAGNAYVAGVTRSSDFPTANAIQAKKFELCCSDGFVAKLNPTGDALAFATYLGGDHNDAAVGVAVDASGNVYVSLYTNSFGFPVTSEAFQDGAGITCPGGGCYNAFVAKISPEDAVGAALGPMALTFSDQAVGTTSAVQLARLNAAGSQPLSVSSVVASGDFAQTNSCGSSVRGGWYCWIWVSFTPTALGTRTGEIAITDNGPGSPRSVRLSGTGVVVAPSVRLSPTSLGFGNQGIATTSTAQTVMLTNTGNAVLHLTSIAPRGDFAQTNDCAASIDPGGSCTISVTFAPAAPGTRIGSLIITDNASDSPQQVNLIGTGIAAVLSPTNLNFGGQLLGTTSAAQNVTLSNISNIAITISGITASGDFAQTNTCGSSVAAGASCTITATFSPTALGTRAGTIIITDNAYAGSVQKIALSGYAVALGASPARLFFPRQAVGTTSRPQAVTLRNALTTPLALTGIKATGDFGQTNDCGGAIPAGGSCTVRVVFAPTVAGTRNGFLTIRDAAESLSGSVLLSGLGVATRKGTGSGRVASH